MHELTVYKSPTSTQVTWLAKYLAGETNCEWSLWFRTCCKPAKWVEDQGDFGQWAMNHTALLRSVAKEYRDKGYQVNTEWQNKFEIGRGTRLFGRPDVLAVKDDMGWVVDAKTGQQKASDRIQVMIYMWALPLVRPELAGVQLAGRVAYRTRTHLINPDEIDRPFISALTDAIRQATDVAPPLKSPSEQECRYCKITSDDCDERM
jgi:hypothetical protein